MGTKSRESMFGPSVRASAERAAAARKEADRLACEAWARIIGLLFYVWLGAACPSWAGDPDRFLEFPGDEDTSTYDLNTVTLQSPGRFTVTRTTIDNPDYMKFELSVIGILSHYCSRPVGNYPAAPEKLPSFGTPDLPFKDIEVMSQEHVKTVFWYYPYKKLAMGAWLNCGRGSPNQAYLKKRADITNGFSSKFLIDCRRGLMSAPLFGDADLAKVLMLPPKGEFLRGVGLDQ
jgi:hypothetical protein